MILAVLGVVLTGILHNIAKVKAQQEYFKENANFKFRSHYMMQTEYELFGCIWHNAYSCVSDNNELSSVLFNIVFLP